MSEPVWVPSRAVQIIHDCQIARHGGASGFRDKGLLQNAVKGPVKKWQYENACLFECAAGYVFGIAKEHAFVDRNRPTAFVASVTFLRLNRWHFSTEPAEGVEYMEGLASDQIPEENFEIWLRQNSVGVF
jgi:death-on-curing protein